MNGPSALGLIETRGFVAAIQAVDAAVTAADIRVLTCEFVGDGIVTVIFAGRVSDVLAAADAGGAAAAAGRADSLNSVHVIPSPGPGVREILDRRRSPRAVDTHGGGALSEEAAEEGGGEEAAEGGGGALSEEAAEEGGARIAPEGMTVRQLRALARARGFSTSQIGRYGKQRLIELLSAQTDTTDEGEGGE